MSDVKLSTIEKALAINLDPLKYGTIAEIGAGQEVARWFFQAGAAAGTVAKTISAYDMKFSDEIYGADPDQRYVSRSRLERMLAQEYDLIISRIEDHRPNDSTFFAFADTVVARGYRSRGECHGWMGVRVQSAPKMAPDDITLHLRLLDDTNIEQQEALGILGVNLIHSAYFLADQPELLLRGLKDNLKWGRIEIDFAGFRGPTLGSIDNRLIAPELVKASLTRAVLFNPEGDVVMPADALYKRSVLGMRYDIGAVSGADTKMFDSAKTRFFAQPGVTEETSVFLAEITMSHDEDEEDVDTEDILARVKTLSGLGFHVLVSKYFRYFRIRQYLARYNRAPVALVTDVEGFADVIREENYEGLVGGFLEGLGKLFPAETTMYVSPGVNGSGPAMLDDMPIAERLRPLVAYLRACGHVVPLDECSAE